MTVVSSFGPGDLDVERLTATGARLLHDYLVYAASGGQVLPSADPGPAVELDPVLSDLADRLRRNGFMVQPRLGSSSAIIDLAVGPAGEPPCVAVESDGPAYAAVPTSRERDRLRAEQLTRLGWVHQRVWSTDVFRDPAREVARIDLAVSRAAGRHVVPPAVTTSARVSWDLDDPGHVAVPALTSAGRRAPRPRVPAGLPIDEYTTDQLEAVVAWICSDTLLRTRDEIAALTRQQLGLARRGSRIDAAIDAAITAALTP
jgi:very-short-patch-repair endonuclease